MATPPATTTTPQTSKRPFHGSAGQVVTVRTNVFEMMFKDVAVSHYDVDITPTVPPAIQRRIYEEFIQNYGDTDLDGVRPVYDGRKSLFSPSEFPFKSRTFEVILSSDAQQRTPPVFKIKIRMVAVIKMGELQKFMERKTVINSNVQAAIMVLDVLIRHKPALLYTCIGRSFFTPEGKKPLTGPVEVWRGFYQSARPTIDGRMMINVDISATSFFQSGHLIETILKILNLKSPDDLRRTSPPLDWKKVEKTIRNLRITVRHRGRSNRSFKIARLTTGSATETRFMVNVEGDDGGPVGFETTVENYFRETYNLRLQFPMIPCAMVTKTIALPLELCTVVEGQRYTKRLDECQTAEMIKFTCQGPQVRANTIKRGLQIMQYDENEYLKDFGVKISPEMMVLQARILPPPMIHYHPSSSQPSVVPRDGSWNLIGRKVALGTTLGSWGVIVFGNERDAPTPSVRAFIRELIVTCMDTGMNVVNKDPTITYLNPQSIIEDGLRQAWIRAGDQVKSKPQLLVCILPNTGTALYAEIKRVTDTIIGVASQCLQAQSVKIPKKPYCANVCLKMNVKLGGMNSQLGPGMLPVLTSKPTILMGADVNHPAAGDNVRPSIAAVVGSMDSKAARYAASIRIQAAGSEIIADLSGMTMELLRAFYQS
ncbi:Eukaryotic translation initiation factor 2C [Modicella reniformis]|uniref:Eukaryotic translation initiation factor 2C n=1 Tax=Modicella reniformis TaxID=1440133 RepID=A0A9P6IMV3_9FUNG|nr:Eukaryotic translation initiation factor 2C [Modicella reniformis]